MTSMAGPSWLRTSGAYRDATIDNLLSRVARSRAEAALQGVVQSAAPHNRTFLSAPMRALEALSAEGSQGTLRMVDDMLDTHGMTLGPHIGSGMESLVFAANPTQGQQQHVLKVAVDLPRLHGTPFQNVDDVPGVAPYWVRERFGNIHAALQPRAAAIRPRDLPRPDDTRQWREISERLRQSLRLRGYEWTDDLPQNMGLMGDGNWALIDGTVTPRAYPPQSTEEAIRMLRMTPGDEDLLRRTVPMYGQ